AVGFDERTSDRETEPGAAPPVFGVDLVEAIEHARQAALLDAAAGVLHAEADLVGVAAHLERGGGARRRGRDGGAHAVREHLDDALAIDADVGPVSLYPRHERKRRETHEGL